MQNVPESRINCIVVNLNLNREFEWGWESQMISQYSLLLHWLELFHASINNRFIFWPIASDNNNWSVVNNPFHMPHMGKWISNRKLSIASPLPQWSLIIWSIGIQSYSWTNYAEWWVKCFTLADWLKFDQNGSEDKLRLCDLLVDLIGLIESHVDQMIKLQRVWSVLAIGDTCNSDVCLMLDASFLNIPCRIPSAQTVHGIQSLLCILWIS